MRQMLLRDVNVENDRQRTCTNSVCDLGVPPSFSIVVVAIGVSLHSHGVHECTMTTGARQQQFYDGKGAEQHASSGIVCVPSVVESVCNSCKTVVDQPVLGNRPCSYCVQPPTQPAHARKALAMHLFLHARITFTATACFADTSFCCNSLFLRVMASLNSLTCACSVYCLHVRHAPYIF